MKKTLALYWAMFLARCDFSLLIRPDSSEAIAWAARKTQIRRRIGARYRVKAKKADTQASLL